MNKIICNHIDYVFEEYVESATSDNAVLKPGHNWRNIPVTEKPTYAATVKQADAGPVREETVTAVGRYDTEVPLKQYAAFPVILRMRSDNGVFYVGTKSYPCMTEVSSNRVKDTFTFRSTSEA